MRDSFVRLSLVIPINRFKFIPILNENSVVVSVNERALNTT